MGTRTGLGAVSNGEASGVEVLGESVDRTGGGLLGETTSATGIRDEGAGTVVEHLLGEVRDPGDGLGAEAAEHSVGLPAAKEFDAVGVDGGTEERGGSPGPEGPSGQEELES